MNAITIKSMGKAHWIGLWKGIKNLLMRVQRLQMTPINGIQNIIVLSMC